MAAYYDSIAQQYKKVVREIPLYQPEKYTYFRLIGEVTGKSILELGCGEGFYTTQAKGGYKGDGGGHFRQSNLPDRKK